MRLVWIGAAVGVSAMTIAMVGPALHHPSDGPVEVVVVAAGRPIAAEADVFAMGPDDALVSFDATARPGARDTPLDIRRARRAYPGAPPLVPHPVTREEQRAPTCNACHAGGGWAPRFQAYTPVTPHPEFRNCLQCHVSPQTDGQFVATDWRTGTWPTLGHAALPGSPPAIPHDLVLRGNCTTCHAGPGAAPEIRTTHPFRANCRQCHAAQVADDEFSRPLDGLAAKADR